MTNHPWHVALDRPYEGLTYDLITSTAFAMEACYSTHDVKPFFLAGIEPTDIYEWLNDAEYHRANMIFVKFEVEADAKAFAVISGGQLMG
ncbi:hypothetical protein [Terasakiella sp.]|uniref:hypothetical protein n=1 Tax=unclassified Terasakiella TaxID=2614952 RepID=UPI003AA9269B